MERPKVGIGAFIQQNGKVLFGYRTSTHEPGTWAPPGGKLEFGESIENSIIREVEEETSLIIGNIKQVALTNDIFKDSHYITIFVTCDIVSGTPKVMEPNKCNKWKWVNWNELPKPLFLPIQNLIKQGFTL